MFYNFQEVTTMASDFYLFLLCICIISIVRPFKRTKCKLIKMMHTVEYFILDKTCPSLTSACSTGLVLYGDICVLYNTL